MSESGLTIDSNVSGLAFSEEETLKTLYSPATWYNLEPNSYSDFGGSITTITRRPISVSRQNSKGVTTDLESSGGFNSDLTQRNLTRLMQGFLFADAREKGGTANFDGVNPITITGVLASDDSFNTNNVAQIETFTTRADVADNLDGKWFQLSDEDGTVGVWIDTDDSGTTIPAGAAALDRAIEVTLVATGDTAIAVATAIVTAITADIKFTATNGGGTLSVVTITHATAGAVADGADGDATFTAFTVTTNGVTAGDFTNHFTVGDLVKGSAFADAANEVLCEVTAVTANKLTCANQALVDETPTADAKIEVVGWQAAADDLEIFASATAIYLTSDGGTDFTTLGLVVGEWIFVGGDTAGTAGNQFLNVSNVPGYARIKTITATQLNFDETTWTAVSETPATGETIQLFFGRVIMNEATDALIVCRTYNLERTLGENSDVGANTQAEYLVGAVCNEMTINVPTAEKLNIDLSFSGLDYETVDAATGVKTGTHVNAPVEDAFNTSSDVYRMRMYIPDDTELNNASFFAYVSEMTLSINNNTSPTKAIGVLGGFDVAVGNFDVSGSAEVFFSEVAAIQAIRDNTDVGMNMIFASTNAGIVFDIPLLSLGGGRTTIEIDQPIKLPLDLSGAKNTNNYTLSTTWFEYLPTAAMP